MTEVWKDIEGYEGIYQVSSLGRVRSLDRYVGNKFYHGKIRVPCKVGRGYLQVGLRIDGIKRFMYLHRLVADAFVPGYFEGAVINHKDENKHNNRADNLEWCTQKYNINYGTRKEKQMEKMKPRFRPVVMKTADGKVLRRFSCIREAARETSIRRDHISQCCRHKPRYYTAGGYIWEWEENATFPYRNNPRKKRVVQMDMEGNKIAYFLSSEEASKATGISGSNIRRCCRGIYKQACGYKWKYE